MLKKLLVASLGRLGYQVRRIDRGNISHKISFLSDVNRKLGYYLEEEANEQILKVRAYTMLPYVRLVTLYQQAVHCEKYGIQGSFVECGVWKGGAVGLMALANMNHGKGPKHIHLFDAFDDICEPDARIDGKRALNEVRLYAKIDSEMSSKLEPVKGLYDAFGGCGTLEENKRLLEEIINYNPDYLHYHKGWFQNTLSKDSSQIEDIAILRLDADWYASTKVCLEYLYDKVVPGGFVIIDDYGYYEGCKKAVDEFIEKRNLKIFLNNIDYGCVYWIKPYNLPAKW